MRDETAMGWTERKLTETLGVELTGQALGSALPQAERRAVYEAVTHSGVVVLPGQAISDDDLYDFANSLGTPVMLPSSLGAEPVRVVSLTNMDKDGRLLPSDARSLQ